MEKFARKCCVTERGINEGYCFGDGEHYFMKEKDAWNHALEIGYKDLNEAYEEDAYYYTEWEVEEGENYFDREGNEYNCKGELICAKEN